VPLAIGGAALLVALAPALASSTTGPITYTVADAWLNASKSRWLQERTVLDEVRPSQYVFRLIEKSGAREAQDYKRIAVPATNGAFARLAQVAAERAYLALAAVIFSLLPLALWTCAKLLGGGPLAAGMSAAYGACAVGLTMVVDGAAENLAGVVFAPLAVVFTVDAVKHASRAAAVRAGLVVAGLAATYPEYGPPLLAAAGVAAVGLGGSLLARGRLTASAVAGVGRVLGTIALVALAVAPYVFLRGIQYYREVSQYMLEGGAARGLTLENAGAWAFGVLHLYQLPNFTDLTYPRTALAAGLSCVLLAVAAIGMLTTTERRVALLAPAVTTLVLATYLFWYQGDKEYALWKWLALAFPFLALGLGAGLGRLAVASRAGAVFATVLVVAGSASIVYTDLRFTRLMARDAVVPPGDATTAVEEAGEIPAPRSVFLEGAEATAYPLVGYIGLYAAVQAAGDLRVSYDAGARGPGQQGDQLLRPDPPLDRYERPGYRYVLTTFAGLGSNRSRLGEEGRFAFDRRPPVDVLVVGVASWTGREGRTVPYATAPFELWIDSPAPGTARLEVETAMPQSPGPTLSFEQASQPVAPVLSGSGARLCVTVPVRAGFTKVLAVPQVAQEPPPPIRTSRRGRCGKGTS
jgi:hypothetical protein